MPCMIHMRQRQNDNLKEKFSKCEIRIYTEGGGNVSVTREIHGHVGSRISQNGTPIRQGGRIFLALDQLTHQHMNLAHGTSARSARAAGGLDPMAVANDQDQ